MGVPPLPDELWDTILTMKGPLHLIRGSERRRRIASTRIQRLWKEVFHVPQELKVGARMVILSHVNPHFEVGVVVETRQYSDKNVATVQLYNIHHLAYQFIPLRAGVYRVLASRE
jgi:hypothetical protein